MNLRALEAVFVKLLGILESGGAMGLVSSANAWAAVEINGVA